MSLDNIIGGILRQGMSGLNRLQTGAQNAEKDGGIDGLLRSVLGGQSSPTGQPGIGGLADMAKEFLNREQAGGMSGAKIGGLGALVGGLLGGGLRGAAKGGAVAILGTLALKAWRDHQAHQGEQPEEPTTNAVEALTAPDTEQLILQAMIGAAQADGQIDASEMERLVAEIAPQGVSEEELRLVRAQINQPIDLGRLGAQVQRPEVAAEIYLAALVATEVDTPAEQEYLRRLAVALKLDEAMVDRLHTMTGSRSAGSVHKPFA